MLNVIRKWNNKNIIKKHRDQAVFFFYRGLSQKQSSFFCFSAENSRADVNEIVEVIVKGDDGIACQSG